MKSIALAAALSVAATAVFAGGMNKPVMEPVVVKQQASSSSSGGVILPLIILLVLAAGR